MAASSGLLCLMFLPGILSMGTKFEKCALLDSDLCFEIKIKEAVVKIGPDGTDDDVTLTFCSDVDTKQCCTTPALKKLFKDDWKTNDTQTWKAKDFGTCKDKVYKIKKEMLVTLSKSGKDRLLVNLIDIYGESPDKKVTEIERFQCKNFDIGDKKLPKETIKCQTGPYHYQQIEKALFQIGNDGTDNDVTFKIASDANNVTCSVKLSHTFSDDWNKDKLETWLRSSFGDCGKDKLYKITNAPLFSMTKNGKDDLVVRQSTFYMRRLDNGQTTKYACGPFNLKGDCKDGAFCTHTFTNCKSSVVAQIGLPATPKTSAGRTTVTTTTTTATTTKKGLLSKIFGSAGRTTVTTTTTTTTTTTATTTNSTATTTKKGLLSKIFG